MGAPELPLRYPVLSGTVDRPLTLPVFQTDPLLLLIFYHPYLVVAMRPTTPLNSELQMGLDLPRPPRCPQGRIGSRTLWKGKDERIPGRKHARETVLLSAPYPSDLKPPVFEIKER